MWSSSDSPAGRFFAARSSILPIYILERVAPRRCPKAIKASREFGFYPRGLRAVPCLERVPRLPRRGTPVQYTLTSLALESRRQEIPRQRTHVHTFVAEPLSDNNYRLFCVYFPYGNVLRWI